MPPGVPEEAETVSVKVTEVPKTDGLGDEVKLDLVGVEPEVTGWVTCWDSDRWSS